MTVLKTYRTPSDHRLPTKKADAIALFSEWKDRPITTFNGKVTVDLTITDNENIEMKIDSNLGVEL